jgi:hypothetical protein
MAILDLKSNLSQWRKPSTVESGEKQKLSESPVKAVYSTSTELKSPTDIKINKVDNSTSIQVPGAKKIDYKIYSINSNRRRSLPAISTLFGDTILDKVSTFKKQIPEELNKVSSFIKITPRGIQHISSVEIIKTILKEKLSLYIQRFPINISKLSLYIEQRPIDILKLSLYKDQLPAIIDKLSLYKTQIPSLLDKLSLYKTQVPSLLDKLSLYKGFKVDNTNSIYDTRQEIIRLLRFPLTIQIYANKFLPTRNGFDDLTSGARGFIRNQKELETAFLGISGTTYTYPKTVRDGRLNDITKIVNAQQWPSTVSFGSAPFSTVPSNNPLYETKYYRTTYSNTNPYLTSAGITGDNLRTYFTRTNSPSAKDKLYTTFNLRDNSFNTGLALFDQPLILSGIQRKGTGSPNNRLAAEPTALEKWKFDDGFIRGGVVTSTQRAIVDVLRLGKWFASVKGLLFITRQAGLQGSAPNTEADPSVGGRAKNGAYSLISSLANTATQHLGLRFRKDAIPFRSRTTYSSVIFGNDSHGRGINTISQTIENNRLNKLYQSLILGTSNYSLSGPGGPQSVYGIGVTNINRVINSNVINYSNEPRKEYYTLSYNDIVNRAALTSLDYKPRNFLLRGNGQPLNTDIANSKWIATQGDYQGTVIQNYAETSQHKRKKLKVPDYGKRGKDLRNPQPTMPDSDNFQNAYKGLGSVGMTDPIWQINQTDEEAVDDFVKFMFHDLNTNERFRFRAYIENVSEDFSPDWQQVKILGRADSPYIYQGFERNVSISFKVAALSRGDLMLMWDQLERLSKTTVPRYQLDAKMKGPLIKFTLGNWFINTPAFIRSLSYTVDNESPWEINLSNSGVYGGGGSTLNSNSVGELPMIVSVQISMQIFGEVRPESESSLSDQISKPRGITESTHYNKGNLYPLGNEGLRGRRQFANYNIQTEG